MRSLIGLFNETARAKGDQIALIDGAGRQIDFRSLDARARAFAGQLEARGITTGDRVLVAMPVGIDLYVTLAGLWLIGAVAVFPEPALGLFGLRHALKVTRPKGFVRTGAYRFLPALVPQLLRCKWLSPMRASAVPGRVPEVEADAPALISFTSGTTGPPKAIERSHAFLMAQHDAVEPLLRSTGPERDLVAFPVFVLVNLAAGRTSLLPNWKLSRQGDVTTAALTGWIAQNAASRALLPPALCALLSDADPPAGFRAVFTGGGPVFPDVMRRLQAKGIDLVAVYGSTEAEPIAEIAARDIAPEDWQRMAGGAGLLAGPPVPGLGLRIVDDEIQVAGAHVNSGYLDPRDDVQTKIAEAGVIWHRTGDAGYLDGQGRLWLLGRLQGRIEREEPLYPFAIETSARGWSGVRDAALIGLGARAVLAISGDVACLPDWRLAAGRLGVDEVRHIAQIPKDRRHRSKTDLIALRKVLGG